MYGLKADSAAEQTKKHNNKSIRVLTNNILTHYFMLTRTGKTAYNLSRI